MSVGNYNYMLKFIIVGDTYVGKSNLLIQYTQRKFRGEHEITIGCEFMAKNIIVNEKNIRVQVWDTAGQEAFRSITRSYYKNSACAVLVYDITNRDSFNNILAWLKDCRELSPKSALIILAGNKCDKEEFRQVSFQEASEFAKIHELFFMEVSAKTGLNVDKLFDLSAAKVLDKIESGEMDLKDESCGIKIGTFSGKSNEKGKYIKVTDRNGDNQQLIDVNRFNKRKCCK